MTMTNTDRIKALKRKGMSEYDATVDVISQEPLSQGLAAVIKQKRDLDAAEKEARGETTPAPVKAEPAPAKAAPKVSTDSLKAKMDALAPAAPLPVIDSAALAAAEMKKREEREAARQAALAAQKKKR
jgi:hypothetical protein